MDTDLLALSSDEFIAGIAAVAERVDVASFPQRNITTDEWAALVRAGVLLPAVPKEFGGRDSHAEMCRVVETLAEWNLPLGMYTIDAEDRNLSAMVEMLMPPRSMMAAIACGFLRRISREAHAYADNRQIGPAPLSAIRFARYRLAAIDTSYTICAALNHYLRTAMNIRPT